MADYLESCDDVFSRVYNIIPLLKFADNKEKIAIVFTSKFVSEYLSERLPLKELYSYADIAIESSIVSRNIEIINSVKMAVSTINQHDRYFDYYGRRYLSINTYRDINKPLLEEWKSKSFNKDNLEYFIRALKIAHNILEYDPNNGKERAENILNLWMKHLTPCDIVIKLNYSLESDLSEEIDVLLETWAELVAKLGLAKFEIKEVDSLSEECLRTILKFNDTYIKYYLSNGMNVEFFEKLEEGGYSISFLEKNIEKFILEGINLISLDVCMFIFKNTESIKVKQLALLAILIKGGTSPEVELEYLNKASIEKTRCNIDYDVYNLVLYTLNFTLINNRQDFNDIINNSMFYCSEKVEGQEDLIDLMKTAIFVAGLIKSEVYANNFTIEDIEKIIDNFVSIKKSKYKYKLLLAWEVLKKLILLYSNNLNYELKNFLDKKLKEVLLMNPIGAYYKLDILDYFNKNNKVNIIKEFIENLYDEEFYNNEDYYDIHFKFRRYGNITNKELMSSIDKKLKWDVVNYTGHKDYSLNEAIKLFEEVSKSNPALWKTVGKDIYNLSLIGKNYGNREHRDVVESIGISALNCNYQDLWDFIHFDIEIYYDLDLIYKILFECIKKSRSREYLVNIWYFSIGILSWYNKEDRIGIKHIYDAINNKLINLNERALIFESDEFSLYEFIVNQHKTDNTTFNSFEYQESIKKIKSKLLSETTNNIKKIVNNLSIKNYNKFYYLKFAIEIVISRGEMNYDNAIEFLDIFINLYEEHTINQYSSKEVLRLLKEFISVDDIWNTIYIILVKKQSDYDYKYHILCDNIGYFINEFIKCNDISLKEKLLIQETNKVKSWISGYGNLVDVNKDVNLVKDELLTPKNFEEFALNILLIQIDSKNIHRIEIALIGLENLIKNNHNLNYFIVNQWNRFSNIQKEVLFLLFEKWCRNKKRLEPFLGIIKNEYNNTHNLEHKEELYYILKSYFNSINEKFEDINFNKIKNTFKDEKLVFIEKKEEQKSIYSNKVNSVIKRLVAITEDKCYDLKGWIQKNEKDKKDNYVPTNPGDSKILESDHEGKFMEILYDEIANGRWNQISNINIAQAVLNIDDGLIVTKVPLAPKNNLVWEKESEVENALKKNNIKKISEVFERIINDGIDSEFINLGSELYFPIGHADSLSYLFANRLVLKNLDIYEIKGPKCILTNKSLLCSEVNFLERFSKDRNIYTVDEIAGLSLFINGTTKIALSDFIIKSLGITPNANNPLVWEKDEEIIVKNEIYAYPVRDNVRGAYVRQPILRRWVCRKKEFLNMLKRYNLSIKPYSEISQCDY